eukprot:TRINITY_DN2226_c0_g2_i1.p1 TRINITY_DN2226_c0_g2~~TRINITY_DN2226_c0_g2_i1.p1  ORF type:complete len:163 (-),score=21.24 TRINITY_DN2226_c0_g2_i1:71-559(-)
MISCTSLLLLALLSTISPAPAPEPEDVHVHVHLPADGAQDSGKIGGMANPGKDYNDYQYGDWFLDVFDIYITGKSRIKSPADEKGRFCKSKGQCKHLLGKLCTHFQDGADYQYGDWFLDISDIYVAPKSSRGDHRDKQRFCKSKNQCKTQMTKLCSKIEKVD